MKKNNIPFDIQIYKSARKNDNKVDNYRRIKLQRVLNDKNDDSANDRNMEKRRDGESVRENINLKMHQLLALNQKSILIVMHLLDSRPIDRGKKRTVLR